MPNLEGIINLATSVAANVQQSTIGSFLGRTVLANPAIPAAIAVAFIAAVIFYKVYTSYYANPKEKIEKPITPILETPGNPNEQTDLPKRNEELTRQLTKVQGELDALKSKTDKNDDKATEQLKAEKEDLLNRVAELTFQLQGVKNDLEAQKLQTNSTKERLDSQIAKTKKVRVQLKAEVSKREQVQKDSDAKINERKEVAEKVRIYLEKAEELKVEIDKFVEGVDTNTRVGINPAYLNFQKAVELLKQLNKKVEKDGLPEIRYLLEATSKVLFESRNTVLNFSGNRDKLLAENPQLNNLIQFFSNTEPTHALRAYNEIIKCECSVASDLKKGLTFLENFISLYYYFQPLPGELNTETRRQDKSKFEEIIKKFTIAQELSHEFSLKFMALVHGKDKLSEKEIATKLNEIYGSQLFDQYVTTFIECVHLAKAIDPLDLEDTLERAIKFGIDITAETLNKRISDLKDRLKYILPIPFQRMNRILDLTNAFKKYLDAKDSSLLDKEANRQKEIMTNFNEGLKTVLSYKIEFPTEANFENILQIEKDFSAEFEKMIASTDQLLKLDCFKFVGEWTVKNTLSSWTDNQRELKKHHEKLTIVKEKFTLASKLLLQFINEIEIATKDLSDEGAKIKKLKELYQSTFESYKKALAECAKPVYEKEEISLRDTIRSINKLSNGTYKVIDDETRSEIELLKSSAIKRESAHKLMEKSLDKYIEENKTEEPAITIEPTLNEENKAGKSEDQKKGILSYVPKFPGVQRLTSWRTKTTKEEPTPNQPKSNPTEAPRELKQIPTPADTKKQKLEEIVVN